MSLSPDSQVILLLCSHLGLPSGSEPGPLKLREWNELAAKIHASPFGRPGGLLDASTGELQSSLELSVDEAERIRSLLDRGGALAIELERLESLGIWAMTRADDAYPARFRERLKTAAPAVLFGAGPVANIGKPGLAVVGSRNADEEGTAAAEFAGRICAKVNWVVYSGAARGVDEISMQACLESGGNVVGILADSLEKAVRAPLSRRALSEEQLTLLTPYSPKTPFSVGSAMGRNKLIYALADYALVLASDADTGGTWAGATEALKAGCVPVFVRDGEKIPDGSRKLLQRGAIAFPFPFPDEIDDLPAWMGEQCSGRKQGKLFDDE
jgi:predicted Rossmann fold nucleotide-binding protein DprA/Smf involved in DNA uptake